MQEKAQQLASRISLIYGLVAAGWILISDKLVQRLMPDTQQISYFQTYKGLGFVAVTTLLLYGLLRFYLQQRETEVAGRKTAEVTLAGQKQILEMIANDAPLPKTLEQLLQFTETASPDMLSSILLLDEDDRLRHGAAPSLPADYVQSIDGLHIGPKMGSCGTAAFRREAVIVEDIETSPLWAGATELARRHGLRACWSTPIFDEQQRVLGTFAIYFRIPTRPTGRHQELIRAVTYLAAIAITRQRTHAALVKSEARYRNLTEQAADSLFVHDERGKFVEVNRRACESLGYTREELLQMNLTDVEQDFDRAAVEKVLNQLKPGQVRTLVGKHRRKDKTEFPVEIRLGSFETDGRQFFHALARDLTERKQTEEALRRSEHQYADLVNNIDGIVWEGSATTFEMTFVSSQAERILGYPVQDWMTNGFWKNHLHPEDREKSVAFCLERVQQGVAHDFEYRMIAADGREVWIHDYVAVVLEGGKPVTIRGVMVDVTERKKAEAELHRREERFQMLIENASDILTVINAEGVIRFQSPSVVRILGFQPEEMTNHSAFEFLHPEDTARIIAAIKHAVTNPGLSVSVEYRYRHRDGTWRFLQSVGRSIVGESPEGFIVVNSRDLTETRKLEEQFRQSQKMEAIGQLAGGVAHDLNNILTVVHMQLDMLKHGDPLSPPQLDSVLDIEKASRRAADLTRQLLMFSRRQAALKSNLDLNAVVTNITKMLQRILGEDVAMQISYAPRPLPVHADAGMLEQVLLNLAVNSRDAMPRGGRLVIETAVVEFDELAAVQKPGARVGKFACLVVSDTGTGIPSETLPHIFEPFFTTKDVGKGTGLGLASVFGIVQQHHGWINACSDVGKGTTFRVYLPLQGASAEAVEDRQSVSKLPGGKETILLVEDEQSLRVLVCNVLSRLGYRVLEATTGHTAIDVWREHRPEIKLLLTDLVMPDGMTGKQLAEVLLQEDPGLKVIYTSGYSRDIAGSGFVMEDGVNFLSKPFQAAKLAQTVRNRLDG